MLTSLKVVPSGATLSIAKMLIPTGGLRVATSQAKTIKIPNHTKSYPNAVARGAKMGVQIINMAGGSSGPPSINMTIHMKIIMAHPGRCKLRVYLAINSLVPDT